MVGQNPGLHELTGDVIPLSEAAFRSDGTFPVKIIAEGWGSSGYYSKKVLSEAASLYRKGTQMFINHPTRSEVKERPERDLNQLAAYFTKESAFWDDNGPYGPGLYQEAKALPNYAEFLKEAAPVIGVSHYVLGKAVKGEAAGRTGPIIEKIGDVISVDFVTVPGAKGSIGAMFESWRGQEAQFNTSGSLSSRISLVRSAIGEKFNDPSGEFYPYVLEVFDDFAIVEIKDKKFVVPYSVDKTGESPVVKLGDAQEVEQIYQTKESGNMADPEFKTILKESLDEMRENQKLMESKYQDLLKENAELKNKITSLEEANGALKESFAKAQEKSVLAEATTYAAELVEKAPAVAKERIKGLLVRSATLKEGALDREALKALAESEIDYANSLMGPSGGVRGMGSAHNPGTVTLEEADNALIESYVKSGMMRETAERIVRGTS